METPFQNKTIVLGVTGSIAAYKAAEIASRLRQMGALVEVVLTQSACHFISPLTFASVTARKAYVDQDLWGNEGHVVHIGLGRASDLLLIAPASATTLAKLAHGIGDNLLTVTALASHCPMILAPAMDAGMYAHPATAANVETLRARGAVFVGPAAGHLASGLVGVGRMAEPAEILDTARLALAQSGPLAGKHIVITAGGTQEPIDPVRVITNRSSGKQGYAVARAALDAGAAVTLITAPTSLVPPLGCRVVPVKTAAEMQAAVLTETAQADALVMAAAVADFRLAEASSEKIKKEKTVPQIHLERTADILADVAARRAQSGYPLRVVGFAAESQDLLQNAQSKLTRKRLDLIVANDITAPDAGFEVETNRVTLVFADGRTETLPLQQKAEVARRIVDALVEWS
ncbi:bifunctional phosphopantothenoylcysteine decarboxylase/phosphopantothenate--cysteine ligase CoaBC [Levilinea saccharolytica]|uniref:Coenzyme A biosynthesis bifunctional protein CoaBC n=2 Tax=Levilinea saccharolytica TaxID=229921 RepID=A0A0N8GS36_9CHLR|nr:bifunctional phosphopantothenoylcysteine decarboxylase/phosphopantothenate--cysteine ligase CoaBC [Levilinea saccharolytica]KPL88202.1 phosphopantothenoylcysteine decarboxylase [Levilinea saccharolytica]